jgi:hypothetical protein
MNGFRASISPLNCLIIARQMERGFSIRPVNPGDSRRQSAPSTQVRHPCPPSKPSAPFRTQPHSDLIGPI